MRCHFFTLSVACLEKPIHKCVNKAWCVLVQGNTAKTMRPLSKLYLLVVLSEPLLCPWSCLLVFYIFTISLLWYLSPRCWRKCKKQIRRKMTFMKNLLWTSRNKRCLRLSFDCYIHYLWFLKPFIYLPISSSASVSELFVLLFHLYFILRDQFLFRD